MNIKKVIFFHYHFLRGGVSAVTSRLAKELPEGVSAAAACDPAMGFSVEGAGYADPDGFDEEDFSALRDAISKRLAGLCADDTLFWIHNHSIGKNPAFTAAVIEHARKGLNPVVLQIHDFAECGRWKNRAFLKRFVPRLYPVGKNIKYVTLNSRDLDILIRAGVPAASCARLPNMHSSSVSASAGGREALKRVAGVCRRSGYVFDEEAPLLACPVRTIRRKNILESFLCASALDANVVVTLPANSKPERPYERLVAEAARSGSFRGGWAPGEGSHDFLEDVMNASALAFSSSLMEGFGMLFAEAAARGKNVFSRRIPVLDDFPGMGGENIYDSLKVPLRPDESRRLKKAYGDMPAPPGVAPEKMAVIRDALSAMFCRGTGEFSFLDPPAQRDICADKDAVREAKAMNGDVFDRLEKALGNRPARTDAFSPGRIGVLFRKLLESWPHDGEEGFADDNVVLDSFLKPEYFRIMLVWPEVGNG